MQRASITPLRGGLDQITPALALDPGKAIAGSNYESNERGYQRVDGYERFDGRPSPSGMSYWVVPFEAGTTEITAGDIVTGATSGATAEMLLDATLESGTWAGGDATGRLVLTLLTGAVEAGEAIDVAGATAAMAAGEDVKRGADKDSDDATWLQAAIELARGRIEAVPGGGPVRGVWVYDGFVYAFRDDAADSPTECRMYRGTSIGWVQADLGRHIEFTSGGTTEIAEGDTITGATSGATATVTRVAVRTGAWSTGDAAGLLVITGQSGTFQAEDLNVGGSTNVATIDGDSVASTLPPGGRYEFRNHNFFADAGRHRMYGVNGVGDAFEWDGGVFVPIRTSSSGSPIHIAEHRQHLFLAFPGGSLQHSATGDPYRWEVIAGAAELGIGEDITGLLSNVATALVVFGRNTVATLQGDTAETWQLRQLADDAGAQRWTAQRIGQPTYLDDRGLRGLDSTQAFGDFRLGTVTRAAEPLIRRKRRDGHRPAASLRVRAKDQYRLYYDDGTGLTVYFGRQTPEVLPFELGIVLTATASAEEVDGAEVLYAGADDGYVYQLDAGTSFDGQPVPAYLRLAFNPAGSPQTVKRWHRAAIEMDASAQTAIAITAEFSYGEADQPPVSETPVSVTGGGGFYDEILSLYGQIYWSAPVEGRAAIHLDGLGMNASITVISEQTYTAPHTLHGALLWWSPRHAAR